jgi:Bacterial TniB protein
MTDPVDQYGHLNDLTKALASKADEARIYAIKQGFWIGYPRAKEILSRMEDLLSHPRITRMPNMLLVAPSFNGKTSILKRFLDAHPPVVDPVAEATECPVIMIEAPSTPNVGDFYSRILQKLMAPYKPTASAAEKAYQVRQLFEILKVRVLVIDEIHHLIAGGLIKQREFRNALKSLGNETQISIIAAGIEDAFNAFNTDPQMSSRFTPEVLPKWKQTNSYAEILATIENRTPLRKASNLIEPGLARAILLRSEGTLGDICDLVKTASIDAIRNGTELITISQVEKLRWTAPSGRRNAISLY